MKRKISILIIPMLLLISLLSAGCGASGGSSKGTSKVLKPDELLPAKEAAKLIGAPEVTINQDTLKIDSETGLSDTYYRYDIGGGTTTNALFELKQNGAASKKELDAGNDAESTYNTYINVENGKYSKPLEGLGDKAFLHTRQNQVFVLYGDYFFMVGFDPQGNADENKKNEVNIAIAKVVLSNIDKLK